MSLITRIFKKQIAFSIPILYSSEENVIWKPKDVFFTERMRTKKKITQKLITIGVKSSRNLWNYYSLGMQSILISREYIFCSDFRYAKRKKLYPKAMCFTKWKTRAENNGRFLRISWTDLSLSVIGVITWLQCFAVNKTKIDKIERGLSLQRLSIKCSNNNNSEKDSNYKKKE